MAVNVSSGTATGGAEQTLYETSGDASWLLYVDLSNMADGDILAVRAKSPGDGGTYRTFDAEVLEGGQLGPILLLRFGPHAHSLGVRYTLEQPSGTARSFGWRVESV